VLPSTRPNLNNREAQKLGEFSTEFQEIFIVKSDDCGWTAIDADDACPIQRPYCRLPLAKQAEVTKMLKDMKEQGVIEESESPWSSPVILTWKKNRDHLCKHYRSLNDITKKNCFLLSRINDTLDMLARS
jgi:hypothetical protein